MSIWLIMLVALGCAVLVLALGLLAVVGHLAARIPELDP